jgi:AcrR family transcriptional regulator
MGRPREHDERTAAALLAAAERAVQEGGIDALSVRGVASDVGTTTRAVYSLFGSKDGLVVALATRAFELLHDGLDALHPTDDPAGDLVEAGLMFRRFSTEHPALFAIGIQNAPASPAVRQTAMAALDVLKRRVQRLADVGRLGQRTVSGATLQFHALCEGLATVELRGTPPPAVPERMWREALGALVAGFAADQPATVSHSS